MDDLLLCAIGPRPRQPDPQQRAFFSHYSARPHELADDVLATDGILPSTIVDHPVRAWSTSRSRTPRDRAFEALLRRNLPSPHVFTVGAETTTALTRGLALLAELLPEAAYSAVSHLAFVVVDDFDDTVGSATFSQVFGTVFLSLAALRSPWTVAEAILHECMHLKFVELEHTHSIMARGYRDERSPRVRPPWHPESNQMDEILERLQRAGMKSCPPKLNAPKDPKEWLDAPGAPRPKLENEKPKGETVPYEQLLQAWREGRVK